HPSVKVLFDVEMIAEMMKNLLQVHTGAMGHIKVMLVMKNHDSYCLVSI
ncbi:7105_t:CDS:1, partial [Cetraspora pellucida]